MYYNIGVQVGITEEQQQSNAMEIFNFLTQNGLTVESACGILGNMDYESTLNPGNKHSENGAFGLIQWSPNTDLTEYTDRKGWDWFDGTAQLNLIMAEGRNEEGVSGRFFPRGGYNYSWTEFCQLTDLVEATYAYAYERERSNSDSASTRYSNAEKWYKYFTGVEPPDKPIPDVPPITKPKRKMPLYMYLV